MSIHPLTLEWIQRQKKLAACLCVAEKIEEYEFRKYEELERLISVALSDGKCNRCGASEKLTFHHLIEKKNKAFIPLPVYFTQRHFFMNVWVMCAMCHDAIHGKPNLSIETKILGGNILSLFETVLFKQKEFEKREKMGVVSSIVPIVFVK